MSEKEKHEGLTEQDVERVQSLIYIFMWQLQAAQKQQHIELMNTFSALVRYLNAEGQYTAKIERVRYNPMRFILSMKPDLFKEQEIKSFDMNYNLAELDFIYFRDTTFSYKLKKSYQSTHTRKRSYRKKINLSQIIIILSYIREWVFGEFLYLIKKHNLAIPQINLPQTGTHNLHGVGINQMPMGGQK